MWLRGLEIEPVSRQKRWPDQGVSANSSRRLTVDDRRIAALLVVIVQKVRFPPRALRCLVLIRHCSVRSLRTRPRAPNRLT